ncbi:MAG: CHAT domain-containing protein [Chloroflexi bacterium]|nr:CHAT domain-containing protein [Chloroflexota bacterium]
MLRPVVVLDASMLLRDVLEALHAYPDATDIVIKRREGARLYWYAKTVGDVRRLSLYVAAGMDDSLKRGFNLHEYESDQTYQLGHIPRRELDQARGVMLDGDEAVGVLIPELATAARGARPAAIAAGVPEPIAEEAGAEEAGPEAAPAPAPRLRGRVKKNGGGGAPSAALRITAYPRLDAPANVAPGEVFDLGIGLSAEQILGVAGGPMAITTPGTEFDLVVQVIAHNFVAPKGIRRFLHVVRSRFAEAETSVTLVAPEVQELLSTALEVEFSYEGNLLGRAWREIRVVPAGVPAPNEDVRGGSTPITQVSPAAAPDLTVGINVDLDDASLLWTFTSPHSPKYVELPSKEVGNRFDRRNAQMFALDHIKPVAEADGTLFINEKLMGVAREIADQMPPEFWDVLGRVWAHVKAMRPADPVPSVLLVSSEPYVPWELASVEEDYADPRLTDPARPLLLGAQLRLGRWMPEGPRTPRGLRRPKLPPETNVNVNTIALIVGDYAASSGQRPLPKAKEEGKALSERYTTVWLEATEPDLNRLLENRLTERGEPVAVQGIHFACHGEVSPDPRYNGIVLSDRTLRLEPDMIRGSQITRATEPFVFVNACQLGQSSETLTGYGGLASAFLKEGCRGFIAPLWSVNDAVAHEVALEFYERALSKGVPVSEVMRDLRSKFDVKAQSPSSTFLAYVFYGHPKLSLSKGS